MPPEETPTQDPAAQTAPQGPIQDTPEAPSGPTEAPVEVQTVQLPTPTAQIPANEPLEPQPAPEPRVPVSVIAPVMHLARDLAAKARAVIQSRKRTKLEKIMAALAAKGSITNDEVEKLLHVSDATATRYLAQLKKEGKIQQVGRTGKSVKYQKL